MPPDTSVTSSLVVPARHAGPPAMANGGWIAGRLAAVVGGDDPVEITLRRPTPLDVALTVVAEPGAARLVDAEGTILVEARAVDAGPPELPAPVGAASARAASTRFVGHHDHPFPDCYVCGTTRVPGVDGLGLHPGPVPGRPDVVAGTFVVPPGDDPHAAAWAALDCPTGWAHADPAAGAGPAVLGRITGWVREPLPADLELVVVARRTGVDGRKLWATSAILAPDGRAVAAARATWLRLG